EAVGGGMRAWSRQHRTQGPGKTEVFLAQVAPPEGPLSGPGCPEPGEQPRYRQAIGRVGRAKLLPQEPFLSEDHWQIEDPKDQYRQGQQQVGLSPPDHPYAEQKVA